MLEFLIGLAIGSGLAVVAALGVLLFMVAAWMAGGSH